MRKSSIALRAGAVVATLVTGTAVVGMTVSNTAEDSSGSTVVATMADAGSLEPGNEVRAAGARVGKVQDISLDHGKARLTLEVFPSILPLHRDARLAIRPVDLLGEHYVDLHTGSPSEPYMRTAVIPEHQTEKRQELQDVLDTFDDPTSTSLAALVTTLGEGVGGGGPQAAEAIKALEPTMRSTADLGVLLNQQNAVLNQLLDRARPLAQAVAAKDGKVLDGVVESTDRVLTTTASNQQALEQTVAELPSTITAARGTLQELSGASSATTPVLQSVRPVTDNLNQIADEANGLADAADPALKSLRPVLEHADGLLHQAAPTVAQLRESGPEIRSTASSLRPLGDVVLDKNLFDLMEFVRKWSLSTNERDALGHYFRGVFHVTPRTLNDLAGAAAPKPPPGSPDPSIPGTPPLPPVGLPKLPPGDGGATGLTPQQEQSLLGQLLGGP